MYYRPPVCAFFVIDSNNTQPPAADQPILHTLGYVMHEGPHGIAKQDYPVFLKFMQMYLLPAGK